MALVLGWLLLATLPAGAEDADAPWNASLIFENDVLWVDDSDRHYTNGIQFCVHLPEGRVWGWLDRFSRATVVREEDAVLSTRLSAGQSLYTPENLRSDELIEDDRPYAGWLHADLGVTGVAGRNLSILELSLGLVGPSAGGEALQKWFHEIIDSPDPLGWEHQLHDELAVLLVAQKSWGEAAPPRTVPGLGPLGVEVDAIPHVDVNLGNVFTHLGTGVMVRLGSRLARDLGPPRMRPSPPGAALPETDRSFQWYVFGGVNGRWVLHNIFLDGNTFGTSHSVDKEPIVGEANLGIALAWQGARFSFTHTVRSPEFTGQRRPDHFGSITFAVTP